MKKFLILLISIMGYMSVSATSLIYTPYYMTRGTKNNNNVQWEQYVSIYSSSIIVSQNEIEFNIDGEGESVTLYGFKKKTRGRTKTGGTYLYYQGLKDSLGSLFDVRIDFIDNDWIIIFVFPKNTSQKCYKFKCKYLCEY